MTMQYRSLGKSSLSISVIAFGCMSLPEDLKASTKLLHNAIELGINFFDTADLYQQGLNEEMVGKALKEKRKDLILTTKVGNQLRSNGIGWDWNASKAYILSAIDESLKRLQTDYIDLYQLHGGTIEDPIDDTIEAFELLQQRGKIRYYGISSIRPNVIREYVKRSRIVSVMMQYGLLDRRPEEECLSLLKQNNIGVLARGTLAKGLLAGKPAVSFLNHTAEAVSHAADAVKSISSSDRTASQTAIQFVLQHPAITSAIVGIRTMDQLQEIAAATGTPALSPAALLMLQSISGLNYYDSHR
jgi:aryl-alcohol dehydrogenase-like predicted oxidoreductase